MPGIVCTNSIHFAEKEKREGWKKITIILWISHMEAPKREGGADRRQTRRKLARCVPPFL